MKRFLFIAGLLMTPFSVAAPDNDVVEGALGFMLGGDGGWARVSNDYKVDGCRVTYVQGLYGDVATVEYDFNKANYKSATTQFTDNRTIFSVSGDRGIQVMTAVTTDGKDASATLIALGLTPGASTTISFLMPVTEDRFLNALADLKNQCPGKKSKY